MVTAETLPSGLRLVTERMPHVRSVTVGVWLTRGSRHESDQESGVAHFVEHMLFKGTTSRSARDIAQTIDSIGGQLDAFTAKEYAAYYVKVLDEHLPVALDLLSDMIIRPALSPDEVTKEQGVILEEIKMVEDAPDDLVHEIFAQQFWAKHPLGRPILGTPETVGSFASEGLRKYFSRTYVASNLVVSAAGNLEHAKLREMIERSFAELTSDAPSAPTVAPAITPGVVSRQKDIEQNHLCIGTPAYPQAHKGRYGLYLLNTILGGSMSSRLFQHIREERGLAYAVFSNLTAYIDTGTVTIYAGCAPEKTSEVVALAMAELRNLREQPVAPEELRRAKDHLKGSLMLGLESTSSRMSHIARQEIYFHTHFSLDEMLQAIERVTVDDIQSVARDLFVDGNLVATLVGPRTDAPITVESLRI